MKKYPIPEGAKEKQCNGCGAPIYFIKTFTSFMPVEPDGTPHWKNCPKAAEFRKRKAEGR